MNAKRYQESLQQFAVYPKAFALEYLVCGLASEAGKAAGKLKKLIRGDYYEVSDPVDGQEAGKRIALDSFEKDLHAELGDVMWYVARICSETGTTLDKIMADNIKKLKSRLERNTIKGSGDAR